MRKLVRTERRRILAMPTTPDMDALVQKARGEIAEARFLRMCAEIAKPGDFEDGSLPLMAPYYYVKYRIAFRVRPARILEIGVRAGYSAWAFLRASPQSEYLGIDAYCGTYGGGILSDGLKEWAENLIARAGCQTFLVQVADSQRLCSVPPADLYHVDADHSYAGARHDISLCYASAPVGSTILVDDYDFLPDVHRAFEDFRHASGLADGAAYIPSYRGEGLIFKAREVPPWVFDLGGRRLHGPPVPPAGS